ncbi:hypothetical protein G5714_015911 [Onychostoma macrolepis]|uniref:Uncharacterized protein n=1 Tax=Onychostoma macrolepis TaxID=369639 RepID=A0A7J6C6W6_9TELE|nr:hypothetical protein G5714_015911 [Onychostoma macrolepis]
MATAVGLVSVGQWRTIAFVKGDTYHGRIEGTSLLDGGSGVCINGGHLNNNSIDIYTYCCTRDDETEMSGPLHGNLLAGQPTFFKEPCPAIMAVTLIGTSDGNSRLKS